MKSFRPDRYALLALLLGTLLLVELHVTRWMLPLQHKLSDAMLAQHALQSQPDPDIVIIDIDERSLSEMSPVVGRWPWPRSLHGELVKGVARQQPAAIVFDILFSDPDFTRPEADRYFAEVIGATPRTYFPMLFLGSDTAEGIPLARFGQALGVEPQPDADPGARASLVLPLPAMLETGRLGTHNAVADADGVVRRYPLYFDVAGWHIPTLPATLARDLGYAVPQQRTLTLHWHGRALSYPRVSYADVHGDLQRRHPQRPAAEFTGKIVIIGSTATGLHDVRATPIDGFYPGVEILATAIDNLKNANALNPVPAWPVSLAGVALLLVLYVALVRGRRLLLLGGLMLLTTLLVLALSYAVLRWQYLVPVLVPLTFAWGYFLIAALMEYLRERKAREQAVATFSRFLDPRVVASLVERGETTQSLSGKSREISVLFSDIRGFTTLSEQSTPEQVVALLNDYFTLQAGAIFAQQGTLDKYIGDAIMAFWGAPNEQPDHALRAVAAALEMSDRLEQFRRVAGELGKQLEIGIGVHSGPAVVGFIGAQSRQDYTAIGDTVNLASRIEGETKGICRVLVSEDTRRLCELQDPCPYQFIDRGSHQVKGRTQVVQLYEPRMKSVPT